MELHAIGIDLGKTLFHLVGVDAIGNVVVRKRCSRTSLLAFTGNLRVNRIGVEACAGAHFLARCLREQGHDVRLMPAQYVKPYVKTNKSDYIDDEAIAEAVQRSNMRFVPIQDRRATGPAGRSSRTGTLGSPPNGRGQSDPQPFIGTWANTSQGTLAC